MKLNLTESEAAEKADQVIEHDAMFSRDMQREMMLAETRHDYAGVAGQIARDRYNAGSQAAVCAVYVLLKSGLQAALDFASDISHHEE